MGSKISADMVYGLIGRKIKAHREASNIHSGKTTQGQLAEAIGVSRVSVANYEAGKQSIYISDLYKISQYLDVDIADFLPSLDEIIISTPEEKLKVAEEEGELSRNETKALKKLIKSDIGGENER